MYDGVKDEEKSSAKLPRRSRNVREHEVLRIAGAVSSAKIAIREVLKWAQKRCGGKLPPEAWEQESFDYFSGGRNSSGVRFRDEKCDLWSIRTDDPDKNVPERIWTTEVVVGSQKSELVQFSVRLLVNTTISDPVQIEPHTPGFVQQVVKKCDFFKDNIGIDFSPHIFENEDDADNLINYLIAPDRKLPVFIVTLPERRDIEYLKIDVQKLGKAVLGIGYVALVYPKAAWRLTDRLGKLRSVFGGAVRVYLPGFSEDADPYTHRLVLASQLETGKGAATAARWMQQLAARESIRQTKLGREVIAFAAIRDLNLRMKQELLEIKHASPVEKFEAAKKRISALEKQIASLNDECQYYTEEYERERERAEFSESQAQRSAYRIQQLLEQLKTKGDNPDESLTPPEEWTELPAWCEEHLAGRLVLTSNACRGIRNTKYVNIRVVAKCLIWLASECRDHRINGSGKSINNMRIVKGIHNARCGSDTYDFDWNGRKLSADWHIKSGGNTRDPVRCLRIYYCFDQQTQQIIVSDMPAHRRTSAT